MEELTLNPFVGITYHDDSIKVVMLSSGEMISLDYNAAVEYLLTIAPNTPFTEWRHQIQAKFPVPDAGFDECLESLVELRILLPKSQMPSRTGLYSRQDAFFSGAGHDGHSGHAGIVSRCMYSSGRTRVGLVAAPFLPGHCSPHTALGLRME